MLRLVLILAFLCAGCTVQPTEYQYSPLVYQICQTSRPGNGYRCILNAPRPNPENHPYGNYGNPNPG
jgi:hypothetical protein